MPSYHFQVKDGHEGAFVAKFDLPDPAAARAQAMAAATDMIRDSASDQRKQWSIEVKCDAGKLVCNVKIVID